METLIVIAVIAGVVGLVSAASKGSGKSQTARQAAYRPKLNEQQIDIEEITLSEEQQSVYSQLENTSGNFFITGKAGTGKSVLLRYFKTKTSKRIVVAAPTGVAALNVGGQTIHSLFKIPPAFVKPGSLSPADQKTNYLLRNLDAVVIDEISMVRADLMDAIDQRLRYAKRSNEPFGGVQMIMFGDLYQLPPVVADPQLIKYFMHNHGGAYFFNAYAWKKASLKNIELSHIFRQSDPIFKDILNAIRKGEVNRDQLNELNKRSKISAPTSEVVTLASTNRSVDEINSSHLAQLDGEISEYTASITGKLEEVSFPTEENLRLKVGAQVMLIKNDKEKRWVNGSVGKIAQLQTEQIIVVVDGIRYPVQRESWSKIRYYYDQETRKVEEEIVSSFTQFPLRLAWAMTIHKSQGQTYGSVIVGMAGGAFAHGQTYVALSRCKSLEGLFLTSPIQPEDIMVDPAVIVFMGGKPKRNSGTAHSERPATQHTPQAKDELHQTQTSDGELTPSEKNRLSFFIASPEKYCATEKARQKVSDLVDLVPKMSSDEEHAFARAYQIWKQQISS